MIMRVIVLLSLCGAFGSVSSEFFHEPSFIELKPGEHDDDVPTSQFGFSIAYQDSTPPRLVVGAPLRDFVGKVYSCPLSDLSSNVSCAIIEMAHLNIEEKTREARKKVNPYQNFFFGASIAATPDYFLTCAPLLTKSIKGKIKIGRKLIEETLTGVVGGCFVHNASTYYEWIDNGVKFADIILKKYEHKRSMRITNTGHIDSGSVGWNTLADTDNGHLLVAKSSYYGDILSVPINNPLESSDSLILNYKSYKEEFKDFYNTGYGMAVGNFFSKTKKLYAVSTRSTSLKGRIVFLENDPLVIMGSQADKYFINNEVLNSMFGYAMGAADINGDDLSELLVGAPAQSDDQNRTEFGALHIYIGGDMLSRNDKNRMRTILGNKADSRFGSAIAVTDIDGDNIPEIFVSSPYENNAIGAVYVISGYELNQVLLSHGEFKQIMLNDLVRTQRLQGHSVGMRFGFNLQIVKDVDENGCNEVAIGSPGKSSVQLFRCLPAVTAYTTLELLGSPTVGLSAKEFIVQVCLIVAVDRKCKSYNGQISVTSYATMKTTKQNHTFIYDLNKHKEPQYCKNITVDLALTSQSEDYTFSTKLNISDEKGERKKRNYMPWVVLSGQSNLENSIFVRRRCNKSACAPELSYNIAWEGGKFIDTKTSEAETVLIQVNNTGQDTNDTHLLLIVHGARISPPTVCFEGIEADKYECTLPKPLKQNIPWTIRVVLNTTDPTNAAGFLNITAQLNNTVFSKITYEPKYLTIPYLLEPSSVLVNGSDNNFKVTDEDLENSRILTITDDHEYYIFNNGTVTWLNLTAILEIEKQSFINDVIVNSLPQIINTEVCVRQNVNDDSKWTFHCKLTLRPGAVKKIIATFEITKKSIETDITKNNLATTSKLSLHLVPTNEVRQVNSTTQIQFQKVLSVKNNKGLVIAIVVAVAVVFLLLLIFILYKYGFFKRAEKKKLDILRESVRKRSIRQASESSRSHKPSTADGTHCEIEVVDDCVFQEIDISPTPTSSNDDVMLIKDTPKDLPSS